MGQRIQRDFDQHKNADQAVSKTILSWGLFAFTARARLRYHQKRDEEMLMEHRVSAEEHVRSGNRNATVRGSDAERSWTINEVRAHVEMLRTKECARHEKATKEREQLVYVGEPCTFLEEAQREDEIRAEVAAQTAFSMEEQALLKRYATERDSWNPFVRASAMHAERSLQADQQQRHDEVLQKALQRFRDEEIPRLQERAITEQRAHEEYVRNAFRLEEEINDSYYLGHHLSRSMQEDLDVIERSGITHIEGIKDDMNLEQIDRIIEKHERRIPENKNRLIRELFSRQRGGFESRRIPDRWSGR